MNKILTLQLFESENRELRLNEMGNPLEVLSYDFENKALLPESAKVMPVGR